MRTVVGRILGHVCVVSSILYQDIFVIYVLQHDVGYVQLLNYIIIHPK